VRVCDASASLAVRFPSEVAVAGAGARELRPIARHPLSGAITMSQWPEREQEIATLYPARRVDAAGRVAAASAGVLRYQSVQVTPRSFASDIGIPSQWLAKLGLEWRLPDQFLR
jgi:hypothetical protein